MERKNMPRIDGDTSVFDMAVNEEGIMQLKKLVAGLASTAMLLSCLVIGASAANADDAVVALADDATAAASITVTGDAAAVKGHTFKAVRIGTYTYARYNADKESVSDLTVETDASVKQALTNVLNGVDPQWSTSHSEYADNPAGFIAATMGYVDGDTDRTDSGSASQPKWSGKLRNVLTKLVQEQDFDNMLPMGLTNCVTQGDSTGKATFTNLPQGFYVIVDTTTGAPISQDKTDAERDNYRASIPMAVGTKVVNSDGQQFDLVNAKGVASNLGTVEVKNDRPTIAKSITGIKDGKDNKTGTNVKNPGTEGNAGVAQVGDTVEYTLSNTVVPNATGYDTQKFKYTFKITDTLYKGQTFNNDVKVRLLGDTPDKDITLTGTDIANGSTFDPSEADYSIAYGTTEVNNTKPAEGSSDKDLTYRNGTAQTFVIDLSAYVGGYRDASGTWVQGKGFDPNYIGRKFVITYSTTLNNDAIVVPDGSNDNGVKLTYSNQPGSEETGDHTTPDTQVFMGKFALQKTNGVKDDNGNYKNLAGAEFQVKKQGENTALYFVKQSEGVYKLSEQQEAGEGVTNTLTVGQNGRLDLTGLEGTYTVTETKQPAGYSGAFLPTFDVTVHTTAEQIGSAIDNSAEATNWKATTSVSLAGGDFWKLVTKNAENDGVNDSMSVAEAPQINIKNVTSISELPKTGGAGLVMAAFVAVIAFVIGGVALKRYRTVAALANGTMPEHRDGRHAM